MLDIGHIYYLLASNVNLQTMRPIPVLNIEQDWYRDQSRFWTLNGTDTETSPGYWYWTGPIPGLVSVLDIERDRYRDWSRFWTLNGTDTETWYWIQKNPRLDRDDTDIESLTSIWHTPLLFRRFAKFDEPKKCCDILCWFFWSCLLQLWQYRHFLHKYDR